MSFERHPIGPEERVEYELAVRLLGEQDHVFGIDIGYQYSQRAKQPTGKIALRVLVQEKKEQHQVDADEVLSLQRWLSLRQPCTNAPFPPHLTFDVVSVPLRFAGMRPPADDGEGIAEDRERTRRSNPIQPGISVSHGNQSAGTLGAIVYLPDGRPAILSCAHVLAPSQAKAGNPIYQPSAADGGDPRFDAVAFLEEVQVGANGSSRRDVRSRRFDAAIAELNRARMVRTSQFGTQVDIRSARRAEILGEILTKSGRGSGATRARVDGIGRYRVQLSDRADGKGTWIEGFLLLPIEGLVPSKPISAAGDSGAVWYHAGAGGVAVGLGLHVAGETCDDLVEYAIASHLQDALEELGVTLKAPERGEAAERRGEGRSAEKAVSGSRYLGPNGHGRRSSGGRAKEKPQAGSALQADSPAAP
jgi:hypothetical protein